MTDTKDTKSDSKDQKLAFNASCLCGATLLEFTGNPTMTSICHCSQCRNSYGITDGVHIAGWPSDAAKITKGEDSLVSYSTSEGTTRFRCGKCYSPTHVVASKFKFTMSFPTLFAKQHDSSSAQRKALLPLFHVFYGDRLYDVNDQLPKFKDVPSRMGGSDELLDYTGKSLGKAADQKQSSDKKDELLKAQQTLRIGDVAPDFEADSSEGKINFHKYIEGSWAILFSHPRDNTPVCTTELGRVAQLKDEWAKRKVKVLALSVDSMDDHKSWIKDINELSNATVDYPLIADKDKKISLLYGMLDQTHLSDTSMPFTVRAVYIIGPDKKIKLMLIYPASCGRNFDEIIRVIDSLQLTAQKSVATPVDWKRGDKCVVLPSVSDEQAAKLFPKGFTKVKPYLRYTPDPSD
jgi:alkyl hydroperoxide reductase subunit AhpC